MGKEGRGRGRGQSQRDHLASAIAHILWPPARKYSIATGLRLPKASPSQTPEPDGQTDPFPARLPSSIFENKQTKETEKPKIKKKDKHPPHHPVKDTGKVKGEVEEAAEKPLEVPPQAGRGVGGRTPIWAGVGLVEQCPWGATWPSTGH